MAPEHIDIIVDTKTEKAQKSLLKITQTIRRLRASNIKDNGLRKLTQESNRLRTSIEKSSAAFKKLQRMSSMPSITSMINKSAIGSQGKSPVDMINTAVAKYNGTLAKTTVATNTAAVATKGFTGWLNAGKEATMGFNGAALSTLFLGMQMQKTFGGAMKSIFEGYKKAIPEAHTFNVMTNKLSANWEFFKFQLADALTQSPLFQKFVAGLIMIIKGFQKIPESIKVVIVALIGLAAAFGTYLFASSTIKLGISGLIDGFGSVEKAMGKVKTSAAILGAALIFAVVLTGMNKLQDLINTTDSGKKSTEQLKKTMEDLGLFLINDLQDGFTSSTSSIQTWTEALIWLGGVQQNLIGAGILGFTAFGTTIKSVFNVMTFVVQSFFLGFFKSIDWLISKLADLADWAGMDKTAKALNDMSKGFRDPINTLTAGMSEDVQDLVNGAELMKKTFDDINKAKVDPNNLVQEYRHNLDVNTAANQIDGVSKGNITNITNINVMDASDALLNGTITGEQYHDFIVAREQANKFLSGN